MRELADRLDGRLVGPRDSAYDELRAVWNGAVDRRPRLIARCQGVADVVACVQFARTRGLPVAVRGGGHAVTGHGVIDDGLVIDLSSMRSVTVDPGRRIADAQGGATWGDFDRATGAFGLATTGGQISTTGVAGLTLGGGIGWLMRRHGLTVDNLLSVDLVTADGTTLTASPSSHADLFWGLCGGGWNFGVATSFTYRLHPVGTVLGGTLLHPADRAVELLQRYQEHCDQAPDELALMVYFLPSIPEIARPPGMLGEAAVSVAVCDSGPIADGEPRLEALRQFGSPLNDTIRPMPYVDLQSMFDVGAPFGLGAFWKSCYLRELTGDAAETIAKHATRMTSPLSQVLVTHMQGAVSRVDPEATAFGHRDAPHVLEILAKWRMGEDPAPHVEWAERFWDEMRPFSTGGVYVNFLGDEGPEQIRAAYTPGAYDRLVGLKGRYDPENFFSWNQNIPPEPAKATADA